MSFTLAELAQATGAQLHGDPGLVLDGVGTLSGAGPRQISFLSNSHYRHQLGETRAGAVILSADDVAACPVACLIARNPHLAYAKVAALYEPRPARRQGVHPRACVDPAAEVHASAWIGPLAVIEAGAQIGAGADIGPGCVVGERSSIGEDTRLVANVTVMHDCVIGRRVLVQPGAVIGADGFGFANDAGAWVKIAQLGRVVIGDDVEIGANTAVDRGALEDTVIEDGVKLDNLIQIAHNVHIGAHSAMAGCVGIAGSSTVGRYCTLGGGVGLAGHLSLGDNVHVTGMSLVTKSLPEPGVYSSGLAVEPSRIWNRISARLRRLDELFRRLSALEKRLGAAPDKT